MRLAVFDLDYTIWRPEMYQLSGPPRLKHVGELPRLRASHYTDAQLEEMRTKKRDHVLVDGSGTPLRVFPGASYALADIIRLRAEGWDIRAAIASRTDEPRWARICLDHLVINSGEDGKDETAACTTTTTLAQCFPDPSLVEIEGGSKTGHIRRLQRATGIPFGEMVFFDNEGWNIRDVKRSLPDVECVHTPDGMTREAWDLAKRKFGMD